MDIEISQHAVERYQSRIDDGATDQEVRNLILLFLSVEDKRKPGRKSAFSFQRRTRKGVVTNHYLKAVSPVTCKVFYIVLNEDQSAVVTVLNEAMFCYLRGRVK